MKEHKKTIFCKDCKYYKAITEAFGICSQKTATMQSDDYCKRAKERSKENGGTENVCKNDY